MSSKILMPQLIGMLAAASGKPKKQTEAFLKAYFATIADVLTQHDSVKIKDFGTFKVNRVEARKSVNVSTGGEVRIPPHYKIVFTPSKSMAEKVNREFAWLDIVELSDGVSAEDLENAKNEPKEPITVEPVAITPKEEQQSERLGEELEEDFGNIEPVEPFGPIDPDDPEPGQPEPLDAKISAPVANLAQEATPEVAPEIPQESIYVEEPKPAVVPKPEETPRQEEEKLPEEVPQPALQTETVSQTETVIQPEENIGSPEISQIKEETPVEPVAQPQAVVSQSEIPLPLPSDKDFDPYAQNVVQKEEEPVPEEPYYITKDEYENLATKADLRVIARNIKKVRASVEAVEGKSKKRNRKVFFWTFFVCAAMVIGGFFLTYFIILSSLGKNRPVQQESVAVPVPMEEYPGDEDYEPTTVAGLSQNTNSNAPKAEVKEEETPASKEKKTPQASAKEEPATTAPTSPSDIKAMDRITNTRYLTTMAKEHYGNYNLWPYIYLENEGKLGHPDRIKPGTNVVIPNIEKYNIDPSNPKDIEKARKLGVEIYKKYASN